MVKVSVIMPVFNESNLIEKSIESVNNQNLKDIELICINYSSTDNCLETLNKFSKKYNFIKIINGENLSLAEARNKGIKESLGKYIAFLDPGDIFLDKTALKKMYNWALKNDANIVCGNLKRINSDNEILKNPNYKLDYSSYFTEYYLVRPKHYGLPWDFQKNIFKKDFIIKNNIGFPDLKIGSDVLFLVDFLTSIQEIYIIPIDLYGYDYTINGNYTDKFKNYQMKHDYIVHFKILLEILDYYKFKKNANKLKKIFIGDLNTSIKNKDTEFYKIFNEIFDNTKTLSNYKDELLYFDLFFSTLILRNGKIVENFYKTKEKLKEINLDSNLPKKLLLEVEFILSCKNFEDYKLNIDEFIKSIDN